MVLKCMIIHLLYSEYDGIYRFTEEKKGGVIMLLCISVNKYTAVNLENNVYHKFSCSGNTYPVGQWA